MGGRCLSQQWRRMRPSTGTDALDYTSCLPRILYRDGGFFEPADQLLRLHGATDGTEGCEFVEELYPPFTISRPLPEYLSTQGEAFRAQLVAQSELFNRNYARGAASVSVALKNATLYSSVLYTNADTGFRPVYETHRPNDRPYVPIIDAAQAAVEPIDLSLPNVVNVFVGSVGSFNYGHFLVDDLPRIKAILRIASVANGRRIRLFIMSFGPSIDRVRVQAMLHLCRDIGGLEVALARVDKVYRFDTLYYVTPISYHPVLKSPEALAFLADYMAAGRNDTSAGGTRIFVTRRSNHSRVLLNATEIEGRLAGLGFRTVDVETLTFIEQARLFGEAEIIVGCMGAAMTNCLFAKPATWTLYLGPEGWVEPFYWDIAAVRRHHYLAVYGDVHESTQPPHLSSYTIQLGALNSMLAQVPALRGH